MCPSKVQKLACWLVKNRCQDFKLPPKVAKNSSKAKLGKNYKWAKKYPLTKGKPITNTLYIANNSKLSQTYGKIPGDRVRSIDDTINDKRNSAQHFINKKFHALSYKSSGSLSSTRTPGKSIFSCVL